MGTRFYYKQKKGICDPIIEKLAARFGTNREIKKNIKLRTHPIVYNYRAFFGDQ